MSQESITVDEAIKFLNTAVAADAVAMQALIASRVACNSVMRDHPTIQCGADPDGSNATVGILGILNGLFGVREDGWGEIAASFDDEHHLTHFERTPLKRHGTGA